VSTRSKAVVTDALPALVPSAFPGHGDHAPLELPSLTASVEAQIGQLLTSGRFDAWSEALARVGNCAHPVRLQGHTRRVDGSTGEVLSEYSSRSEPLGVTFVRCGNRRAAECPSCSRLYAGDMFQLIRAGVTGGKTVPETVCDNPLVFATVTAPSFGRVHGHRNNHHSNHRGGGQRCHQAPLKGSARCPHGRPTTCHQTHLEDDPVLGEPLCADCYDYASQVVWQWWAPDLWRRFTIALRRRVARAVGVPAARLSEHATVQYAKVAEYQRRGVVHFHALVRLDGPKTPEGFAPAPTAIDEHTLADLVHQAAASVRLTVPGVDGQDPSRRLAFGRQLDARPVRTSRRTDDPDRTLNPEQVAGYLAKYATKSASDTPEQLPHHQRIRATVRTLAARAHDADRAWGEAGPYELLGKWVPELGFRGHFASKSRRYSITLGALNRARRRRQAAIAEHRASGRPLDLAALEADLLADDEDETTLVIGHWSYAGTGWANEAETVLATAAAARAREYDQWKADQRRTHMQRHSAEGTR
jgi:hypothetical protein